MSNGSINLPIEGEHVNSLYLPATMADGVTGVIFQSSIPWINSYGSNGAANNLFFGGLAGISGNFTLTGVDLIGFGALTFQHATSATSNIAFGSYNTPALWMLTEGQGNIGLLDSAGSTITIGNDNLCFGRFSGGTQLITGNSGIYIGTNAQPAGDFTNAIGIGANVIVPASNTIQLGDGNTITDCLISGVLTFLNTQVATPATGVATITNLPAGLGTSPDYVLMTVNGTLGYVPFFHA